MLTLIAQQLDFYQAADNVNLPGVPANVASAADRGFGNWLGNLLSAIMVIAALLLLLYLVWGAIDWVVSGGEAGKIQKARDKMTQAVIGMLVLAASLAIFFLVQDFVGLSFFNMSSNSSGTGTFQRGSANTGGTGTTLPNGASSGIPGTDPNRVPTQGVGNESGQTVPTGNN